MSWESKSDYAGLGSANLLAKSSNDGASGQYLEKLGQDGSIAATKAFGTNNATATTDYVLKDDVTISPVLGTVTTVASKKFMLQQVSITTGAGKEPTVSASSVQVESGASTDRSFSVGSISLSHDEIAQNLLSSFSMSGTDCEITDVSLVASCTVGLHTQNGDPVASSPHSAKVVTTATIGQYGSTAPTVTAASGWEISSPLTCDDPDSDMPTWTVGLTKTLSLNSGS